MKAISIYIESEGKAYNYHPTPEEQAIADRLKQQQTLIENDRITKENEEKDDGK